MELKDSQAKENLLNRLKRIEGQVHALQTMISAERDCRQVLQQMSAARSALQAVMSLFLEEYAAECMLNLEQNDQQARQHLARELVNMMSKVG